MARNETQARDTRSFDRLLEGHLFVKFQGSRVAKMFFQWDYMVGEKRNRNALKQWLTLPLTWENINFQNENSYRECFRYALYESAENNPDKPENNDPEKYSGSKQSARWQESEAVVYPAFHAAIRTEPDQSDLQKIRNAIKEVGIDKDEQRPGQED